MARIVTSGEARGLQGRILAMLAQHDIAARLKLLAPFPNMPEALAALKLWHAAVAARSLNQTRQLIERCRALLVRPGSV